mgnify:CR=1 FL=1
MERILLVSATEKSRTMLSQFLTSCGVQAQLAPASSGAEARRMLVDGLFDLVLVNTPLPDEFGHEVCINAVEKTDAGVVFLVKAAQAEQLLGPLSEQGVLLLSKPFNTAFFMQVMHMAEASNHRLQRARQENARLQEKIAQVRLVSRAKCCLIEREGMTEADAHRLIEKRAMDTRCDRAEIAKEILDSKRTVLADDRLLMPSGSPVSAMTPRAMEHRCLEMSLPDYVKNVFGQDEKEFYQEINPILNTDTRISGINAILSQLGYKIGFSNGYFVFNESSGIQTATGVEAEQQRTVQFVKDVRDKLESCLDEVIYALNVYADLYGLAPVGAYEVNYDFGDILYVRENDRARWWQYVTTGKVPAWLYFVKFEGMTESDAKAMVKEAQPDEPKLFGDE